MTLHIMSDLEQGTEAWHDARRGMVTASIVGKLLTFESPNAMTVDCPKCKAGAGSNCISLARKVPTPISTFHPERAAVTASLAPELAVANNDTSRGVVATLTAERITGHTEPSFMNDDMMRGVLHEPIAREKYAEHNGVTVTEVGFCIRDDWGFQIGASPDGLVGDDGGLEVKCPRAKTHIRTIAANEVPAHYFAQVQTCLLVTGREWWDFTSFCAGLPMWTKRVLPDPKWQAAIVGAVAAFEKAAEALTSDYLTRAEGLPATERIGDLDEIRVA